MLDDAQLCECNEQSKCDRKKIQCDCKQYCMLYERTVADFKSVQCATISPNPRNFTTYTQVHTEWIDKFYKMRRHINGAIIVLELAGLRPHYHCIFDVKDKVGFTATLFSWSQYENVKKHNMFKGKLHYLFKQVDKTKEETGIEPIYTYADMISIQEEKHKRKCLERLKAKQDRLIELKEDIPKWMLADD